MKKAIVTGATGFIGKFLVRELVKQNVEVIAVVRRGTKNLNTINALPVKIVECNIADYHMLPDMIADRDIDVVFHIAWQGVSDLDARNEANLTETDADVLVFTAKRYYESEDKYTYIITSDVDRTKIIDKDVNASIRYMIENNIYRAAAWNKVVKKSIIDSYSMRFKDGYLSEDMDWCGDLLLYAQRFDFYDNPFYAYRQQRNGSITAGKAEKLISDKLYMCEKGYRQALKLEDKEKTELLASYYAYEYSVLLGVSSGVKNKELLSKVKNLQILLNYDISRKVKKVKKLKKYIGYSLTRRALCFFVKIKK